MVSKDIKTPMTAGVVLAAISTALGFICVALQKNMIFAQMRYTDIDKVIIPPVIAEQIIMLLFYAAVLYIMLEYKGNSRRAASVVILVVYAVFRIAAPYLHIISNLYYSRQGSAVMGASALLESNIGMLAAPFTTVSSMLVLIAIGRYGISSPNTDFSDQI